MTKFNGNYFIEYNHNVKQNIPADLVVEGLFISADCPVCEEEVPCLAVGAFCWDLVGCWDLQFVGTDAGFCWPQADGCSVRDDCALRLIWGASDCFSTERACGAPQALCWGTEGWGVGPDDGLRVWAGLLQAPWGVDWGDTVDWLGWK